MSNFSGSYKFSWKRILRPIILFILYAFFFLKPANYIMYIRSFQFLHYLVILSFLSHTFNHAHYYYYWNFDFEIDRIPKNIPNYSKFPDTKLILHLSTTCCHSTAHSQQAPSTSESSCTVRRFKYHKQNPFLSAEQYLISFSLYLLRSSTPPPPPPPLPSVPFALSFSPLSHLSRSRARCHGRNELVRFHAISETWPNEASRLPSSVRVRVRVYTLCPSNSDSSRARILRHWRACRPWMKPWRRTCSSRGSLGI